MAHQFYQKEQVAFVSNLYQDLENYNRLFVEITSQLESLKNLYRETIASIGSKENFGDAEGLFDLLEYLQSCISTVLYKYEYSDEELYELVKDMDRLDDLNERKYWFEQFKKINVLKNKTID